MDDGIFDAGFCWERKAACILWIQLVCKERYFKDAKLSSSVIEELRGWNTKRYGLSRDCSVFCDEVQRH